MRSIRLVAVDGKPRPALVLTADDKREHARRVTVAPISSTVRGSSTELRVGPVEGLDHESVVKCEHIQTVAAALTVRKIGLLPTSRGGGASTGRRRRVRPAPTPRRLTDIGESTTPPGES